MTVVFVHGVPETADIWQDVRERLETDSVALRLPGFGAPVPEGFGGSKEEYARWLTEALREVPGLVDLVGHDWGALLTYRVVTAYDVPLRSWVTDCSSIMHADYVWHPVAQIWQTPRDGEAFNERARAASVDEPGSTAGQLRSLGVPERHALALHEAFDETMGQSILGLYRSALPNPFADWGSDLTRTEAPGLVLVPSDDPFDDEEVAREVARDLGAKVRVLDAGHFWMVQDPVQGAKALSEFWASVDGRG
ncbi:alpha/beta fold hydrolase [Streptomyces sp. NPDC051243]|uniref:alpha/beta fold hydrolase n=1 Tax=Streptomyces sp. NPDC051243 TaxID=3365646 RepID=UPI0037902870